MKIYKGPYDDARLQYEIDYEKRKTEAKILQSKILKDNIESITFKRSIPWKIIQEKINKFIEIYVHETQKSFAEENNLVELLIERELNK